MKDVIVSRRRFLLTTGAAALIQAPARAGASAALQPELTVQEIVARIQQRLPGALPPNTVDGLKAGRTDQRVTGVATTALATADVISRAAAAGRNLVITFEPTFFARADQPSPAARADDPVFAAKRALIEARGVAVWRLHDQWLTQTPDPMVQGLAEALDWGRNQSSTEPHRITLPPVSLRELAGHVQARLGARAMRIVGDPALRVTRVVLSPGPLAPATTLTNLEKTDVVLAGEPREWEGVEYVQDAIAAGQQKGMIIVGRVLSEEPGMKLMAKWLAGVLPGVPVGTVAAGDHYWRPAGGQEVVR